MSEIPSGHREPIQRGKLRLVESSDSPEEHEPSTGLVFFDIDNGSLSEIELADRTKRLADKQTMADLLRGRESNDHPKIIARAILQGLNVLPDLDEMREQANQSAAADTALSDQAEGDAEPDESELEAMRRCLQIEKLLREAAAYNDKVEHDGTKAEFVTELESHMDERGYYESDVLRVTTVLMRHPDMAKYKPSLILSSRLLKTMLLLNEEDATVTPLHQ